MNKYDQNIIDDNFISKVCETLNDSANRIDAETSQRIIAARQRALEKSASRFSMPKIIAVAATAFSIFIAVIIVNTQLNQPLEDESSEAIELVATQDAIELYEELEFYTWLVEEDVTS
ncbi:MAG: DUF3619 family protein [Gammaproteobacteria bacterium]